MKFFISKISTVILRKIGNYSNMKNIVISIDFLSTKIKVYAMLFTRLPSHNTCLRLYRTHVSQTIKYEKLNYFQNTKKKYTALIKKKATEIRMK